MCHSFAISKNFTVHQNKDAQSVPSPEQLTVYTLITKNSLMRLIIYILKQRAQHLLVGNPSILGNLPILGDFLLRSTF